MAGVQKVRGIPGPHPSTLQCHFISHIRQHRKVRLAALPQRALEEQIGSKPCIIGERDGWCTWFASEYCEDLAGQQCTSLPRDPSTKAHEIPDIERHRRALSACKWRFPRNPSSKSCCIVQEAATLTSRVPFLQPWELIHDRGKNQMLRAGSMAACDPEKGSGRLLKWDIGTFSTTLHPIAYWWSMGWFGCSQQAINAFFVIIYAAVNEQLWRLVNTATARILCAGSCFREAHSGCSVLFSINERFQHGRLSCIVFRS